MRTITKINVLSDFKLECLFNDGTIKIADIKPFLKTEVFKPLINPIAFAKVSNHSYYVEWVDHEVDLSADTLWRISAKA
jgi:hypothetical protein